MEFVSTIRAFGLGKSNHHKDDSFVDRLNHKYTVFIVCSFCLVVAYGQYGGSPINCWVPGHFTGNYASYANNICWVSSTYNVPLEEDIPHEENDRKVKMLKYYQWTPFILLFQALLFYLPRMIWRTLNDKSGLDLQELVEAVNSSNSQSNFGERNNCINYITNSFDHYVNSINPKKFEKSNTNQNTLDSDLKTDSTRKRKPKYTSDTLMKKHTQHEKEDYSSEDSDESDNEFSNKEDTPKAPSKLQKFWYKITRFAKIICITKGKRYGNYLLALFVFVKLLYTLNSVMQLFILNHFLGNDYWLLGVEVFGKIWYGDDWTQLKRFPRVTMCDFRIREVGIVHRYTVQCVLSINLFNEKIFIFIWFWLCLVSIFNLFDLVSWTYTLVINSNERYNYVKKRLYNIKKSDEIEDKQLFKKFVNGYLKEDGVLALRILSRNSQDLIVSEAVANLYTQFKNQYKQKCALQKHRRHPNIGLFNEDTAAPSNLNDLTRFIKNIDKGMMQSPPPPPPPHNNNAKFTTVTETEA